MSFRVYEFNCKKCGYIILEKTNEVVPEHCEQPMKRVWGSIGTVFKGSGFYRNDSRKEK